MSTTLKTLKISNGSETRRVTVQKKLTFNELTSLVAGLFNLSAFKIVYQDEENDKITIGSDDEFQEAIETQAKNGVLRLSVKLPSVPKPAEPAAPAPAPVPAQAKPTVAEQAPKPAVATEQAPPKNEGKQEQTNNNAQLPDFQQLLNDFLKTGKVDHSKLREVFSQVGELGKQTAKDASTNVDDVVRALLTSPLAGQLIGLFGEYENNMRQAFSGQPHHGGHHGHHGGRGRWFHHQQQQQNNNNGMEQPQSNVHIHVQCDGCQVQPIVGNRHKCKTCPDYDLCDTCFAKKATIHDAAHEFETRQFAIEPVFHRGVTCDSCQTHPIVGNRYKCKTCPNYDLCDTCFAKKTTVHDAAHEFDKIDRPAIPNRFMWQGRRGPHCGGNWRQFQQQQQQQQQAPQQPGQPQPAQPQQQQPAQPQQQGFCGMSRHLGRFISDVSIQDGTIVFVGQKFVKTWRMKNEGSVAWPADTQLVFVGGDQLSEVVSVPVKAAKPGEEVEISVEMTTKAAGRYTSFWRLCADSQRFGHRVWCDVISQLPAAPAPVVAPVPAQPAVIPALSIHPPVPKPVVESAPAPAPAPIPAPAPAPAPAPVVQTPLDQATEQLVGMGFDAQRARAVLQSVNLDILAAVQILLS